MMNVDWNHLQPHSGLPDRQWGEAVSPDPFLYQADEFHDPERVLSHLGPLLRDEGPLKGARCEILNVRYRFGKSLHVVYRFSAGGMERIVSLRFLPRGESLPCYREALARAFDKEAVAHLPDWDAVEWRFPEDPGLPLLERMSDRQYIGDRLSASLDSPAPSGTMAWDLLSYLPGERCSVRYRFPGYSLVGKMQREGTPLEHEQLVRLWQSPHRRFRMPAPIGLDRESGARWESFAAGSRIESLFAQADLSLLVERVADAAAAFHRTPMEDLPVNGVEQILGRLNKKIIPRISEALSPLAPDLAEFHRRLIQRAASLPIRPARTLHGDFHTANMLVDAEGLVMIDMGRLAFGDPAYDLALFGSRLLLIAMHRRERLAEAADAVAALPAAYAAASGEAIPEKIFAWYLAAALVGRQIKTCVNHRAPGLEWLAPRLLDGAGRILDQGKFEGPAFCG